MRIRTLIGTALGAMVCLSAMAASPGPPAPLNGLSPHELMKQVVYNELRDRSGESYWEYRILRTTGTWTTATEQIETRQGPIYRLMPNGGVPLTSVQQREESARLDRLMSSPSDQARVQKQYEQDEARLQRLMALMPNAFLFDYDGTEGEDVVRLKFRPDPNFDPPTYEARVFHALAGTVWVSMRQKRMTHLQAALTDRVDFGFGLLGHIEKGGTFEIKRTPVNDTHWKTALVDVHIDGKIILFKTITKNQHEERSGFKQVPTEITLSQAKAMLDQTAGASGGG